MATRISTKNETQLLPEGGQAATTSTAMSHRLPEFNDDTDKWQAYLVKVEAYFEANEVTDDARKRALLVAALGSRTIDVLCGRVAPQKPNALGYDAVVKVLSEYYDPRPNEISESFKFFHRNQQEGESVHAFIVEIRRLAHNCNFSSMLDRMLRDRIVCGVRSRNLQKQLLAKPELTLQEAEALALAAERAELDAENINRETPPVTVSAMKEQRWVPRGQKKNEDGKPCECCGKRNHKRATCSMRGRHCYKCGKQGHLARMCQRIDNALNVTAQATDSDSSASQLWSVTSKNSLVPPIQETFTWNGVKLKMDVDTGSPVCVIPRATYKAHRHQWPKLQEPKIKLACYLGKLPVLGVLSMRVCHKSAEVDCNLIVLDCEGPLLCGRDLLQKLQEQGAAVLHVAAPPLGASPESPPAPAVLDRYSDLCTEGVGLMKGPPVRLHIKPGVTPKFFKARKVPYALLDKVSEALDRLVAAGIISPVTHSEWATPIVPVLKKDGTVRICGDFKVTLNLVCELEQYPLPLIEDIFAQLGGGERFSILDLRDAYNQIPLDEESRKLAVINTHKGLFCFNRLPFGIASAPAIFQRRIESILQGLPGVQAYLDDVLIAEEGDSENRNLMAVLERFREHGIKLRADKCRVSEPSVTYLGHRIDANGLHPMEKNVDAIRLAPSPQNVCELRSFLGMVTFYNKFMPDLSTILAPLYKLLKKGAKWTWSTNEKKAFVQVKNALCAAPILTHFDPNVSST